jgi:hypothetical protein
MPPSDQRTFGLLIVSVGVLVILIGLVAMRGWLGWFGHLPVDIRIERPNLRVYVPIGSMILVSILLSALSYVLRRFL